MSELSIRVKISSRAAILAGNTRIGTQQVQVTSEDLSKLSPAQREELADILEGGSDIGSLPDDPPVSEPTLSAIVPVLDARATRRAQRLTAQRAAEAIAIEEAAVAARGAELRDAARAKALREWVTKNGDDEQRARMAEGYLNQDEILELVTEDLLDLPHDEYSVIRRGDACECPCASHVVFEVAPPNHMDSFQYGKLTNVRNNAPEGATVVPIEHRAKCPMCRCLPVSRLAARVSLPWHGWLLRKDFSLR